MPEIPSRPGMAAGSVRGACEQGIHSLFPLLAAVGGEDMNRFHPKLHQKLGESQHLVGVSVKGKLLSVKVRG